MLADGGPGTTTTITYRGKENKVMSIYPRPDSRFYWMKFDLEGRHIYKSTKCTDKRKAEQFEKLYFSKLVREGVGVKKREHYTCTDLLDKLESRWRLEGKLSMQNTSLLKKTRAVFGSKAADTITVDLLEKFVVTRRTAGYATATTNRVIQALRRAFNLAAQPWPRFELPSEQGNERTGFVDASRLRKLLDVLPDDLRDFVEFAFACGWRKAQIAGITWAMVDADTITVPAALCKNRKPHIIPLVGKIGQIVARRRAKRNMESACVFTWDNKPVREFRKTWKSACRKVGLGNLLLHDLRRSCARDLLASGTSQAVAMAIGGWKTDSMFRRYSIVTTGDAAGALERMDRYRAG